MSTGAAAESRATPSRRGERAVPQERAKRVASGLLVYMLIIALTLFVVDRVLIALNLFPPTYNYGHPGVGWVSAYPSGRVVTERCVNVATKQIALYTRNEDGMRTAHSAHALRTDLDVFKVAVSGDSHTELCEPTERVHFGVMERALNAHALRSAVFAYGAGKYSPLQAYLAVREPIRHYGADAFVLNFYTGNDFLDMLRVDDRPHLEPSGEGYRVAGPVWYQLDPPLKRRESRVLFLLETAYEKTGLRRILLRVHYLGDVARRQNAGVVAVAKYINDLRKAASPAVEYPDAFTAQMLNQQLFFHHFPGSRAESLRRVRAVLELVRQENPNRLLVMSPIPSYQLVNRRPVDPALFDVLSRLPIAYDTGVAEEHALYEALKGMALESGWVFVDNLPLLRSFEGDTPFYNRTDYHIEPVVSEIIGNAQARAIVDACTARSLVETRAPRQSPPVETQRKCLSRP